ncbi:hypothetical protein TNCV_3889711 [Trichonephila clavipes]|nr:hypothetical protein TNCV_3889711 [Trichonephila clavipes]
MDHMFSIGDRSGERADQGSNLIWRLTKNLWTMRATSGHVVILLKYDCDQALTVRKDNWLQELGDVVLTV